MSKQSGGSESVFTSMLTVAFIVLKLTGFIDWSWWWVLSPIWIGIAIVLKANYSGCANRPISMGAKRLKR